MKIKVRYLVKQPGRRGAPPRYFWQPSAALREQGYALQRVPDGWESIVDEDVLEERAIAAAQDLNRQLDARRKAESEAPRKPRPAVPQLRSVDALIKLYKTTDQPGAFRFKRNGKPRPRSTQRGYEQCLDRIGAWAGDAPVTAIGPKRVQVLQQAMAATPSFANAVIRVLRLLLDFGRREEWLVINPATKPNLMGTDPSGQLWPHQAVTLFTETADRRGRHSMGTAVTVDEWIGQREGDVLRLPRNLLQRAGDGTVTLRQGKGGVAVSLPLGMVPHLVARVEAEQTRLDKLYKNAKVQPSTLIVSEETGQPYKEDNFRHVFADIRAEMAAEMRRRKGWRQDEKGGPGTPGWRNGELGMMLSQCGLSGAALATRLAFEFRRAASFEVDYLVPGREANAADAFILYVEDLQFMHLRHTAVTRLGEAEASDELISVITGHAPASVKQILQRYLVRTKKLARLAFQKRMDAEGIATTLPTPATKEEGGA